MSAGRPRAVGQLTPEEDERVRAGVRRIYAEAKSQAKVAERTGIPQQSISSHLNGTRAGRWFAEQVAKALHISFEQLVGRGEITESPRLCDAPGWADAEALARSDAPHLAKFIDQVRNIRPPAMPKRITAEWIADFAYLWSKSKPEDTETTG